MPKKMTDVEKSIYEVSSEINHAKQIAKQRSSELKDVYLEEEQLSTENWKDKELSYPENEVRLGTVFSGIGAIEHAFERLKIKHKIIFAGDIDKNCKKSYMANYEVDEEDWFDDVRTFDATRYKNKVDIIVGGAPCQAFSMVGKRLGFEDARGTLFYEFARIIKETNPKVFIFENVKGLTNHDGGRTWRVIHDISSVISSPSL
ncbi:MAG: DNA (cytosine-5-)-methyltransferase [Eubacterium sp.]|nr:DNA (cytosine-5-)-methyltransferase [Eubacterium sp.]